MPTSLTQGYEPSPPAKRPRISEQTSTVQTATVRPNGQPALEAVVPPTKATPLSPTMASALAASLLTATPSSLCDPAALIPTTRPPVAGSQSLELTWPVMRTPQLQAAADRNSILLQAIRMGLTNNQTSKPPRAVPQPSSSDLASSLVAALGRISSAQSPSTTRTGQADQAPLAAALIRQMITNNEAYMSDPDSFLASMITLIRRQP